MKISTRGAFAESERSSSDPLNLLVNASAGMWFWIKQCMGIQFRPFIAFLSFLQKVVKVKSFVIYSVSFSRSRRRIMKKKTLFMVEVAVFAAMAVLLDFISGIISARIWPQGGSVSIAMVPIFVMAFRWGIKGGLSTGFLLGALQLVVTQPWIATPVQAFIDYFVAFTVVGVAGVFAKQVQQRFAEGEKGRANLYIIVGVLVGSILRFICHFATGIIFFGMYAPEGQPVAWYSLIYNGTYMLPSTIISGIVVVTLYVSAQRVLLRKVA